MPPFVWPFNANRGVGHVFPRFGFQGFIEDLAKGLRVRVKDGEHMKEEDGPSDDYQNRDDAQGAEGEKEAVHDNTHDRDALGSSSGQSVAAHEDEEKSDECWREFASFGSYKYERDTEWGRAGYREKWEERVRMMRRLRKGREAMWTTSGLRPLAEPLILDWDWFFREKVPTDARYKALFPDDAEKRSRIKDIMGELEALHEYSGWALMRKDDPDDPEIPGDSRDYYRRKFYNWLHWDLNIERGDLQKECDEVFAMASNLGQWEFTFLDDDGIGTTRIEEYLQKGADIFDGWGTDVTRKYSHLVPQGHNKNPLATFEWLFLDRDGGVTHLNGMLQGGDDFFLKWHDKEIVRKYGHLRSNLAEFARRGMGTASNLDKYGTLQIPDRDIYYDHDGQVKVCTWGESKPRDILVGWPQEAQDKYGHLRCYLPFSDDTDENNQKFEPQTRRRISFRRAGRFAGRTRVGYQPRGIERGWRVFRCRTRSTTLGAMGDSASDILVD